MSKVITDLDCSGNTSYELGTHYITEYEGNKMTYVFDYPDLIYRDKWTKEDIEKFNIYPSWTLIDDKNHVMICGSPVKEKTEKKDKTINKNWFILLIIIGIATMAMSQTIKKQ